MKRRVLIGFAVGSTTAVFAGCLDVGSGSGTPTATEGRDQGTATEGRSNATETPTQHETGETDTPDEDSERTDTSTGEPGETDTPTGTADGTPGEPRLADQDVEIKSVECGSGEDHWEVDVDSGVVTVDGSIGGNHGCYSARIASAEYDGDEDILRTVIESYDDSRDGETACMECIVDIYYRATYTFEDGEPGDVEVQHDGLGG